MAELTGVIKDVYIDIPTCKTALVLLVNEKSNALACYDDFRNADKLNIKVDKYREKRSLNANNYAWKLLTEIGNVLRKDKEEVYLEMLKRYGQSEMISVLSHIPIKQYIKYCEEAGESVLNGKSFTHYKVYKGSSEFDTKEMSIFIDGVVDEAQALGIETKTPEELANLKSLWKEADDG